MVSLTSNEKIILLILLKNFTGYYNSNSISRHVKISRVGAGKILKKFLKEKIVSSKIIGKSIIYKLKLEDDYTKRLISFLLADEANNFKRWNEEFKELFKEGRIIILFGSSIKNYSTSNDIDIMIVMDKKDIKEVNTILKEKEKIFPKPIHAIKLTYDNLLKNIKNKEMIDIIKNGMILYGYDKYVELIKNVTSI